MTGYSGEKEQGYLSANSKEGSRGDEIFLIPISNEKQVKMIWSILINFNSNLYHKLLPSLKVKMERRLKKRLCAEN